MSTSLHRESVSPASALDTDTRQEVVQLRCKLANQPVIEQAKGMLMAAFGLSGDHAFELLKTVSQANNVKVRCVAQQIVECWPSGGPRPQYDEATEFLLAVRHRFSPR